MTAFIIMSRRNSTIFEKVVRKFQKSFLIVGVACAPPLFGALFRTVKPILRDSLSEAQYEKKHGCPYHYVPHCSLLT